MRSTGGGGARWSSRCRTGSRPPNAWRRCSAPSHVLGGLCRIIAYVVEPGHIRHVGVPPSVTLGELERTDQPAGRGGATGVRAGARRDGGARAGRPGGDVGEVPVHRGGKRRRRADAGAGRRHPEPARDAAAARAGAGGDPRGRARARGRAPGGCRGADAGVRGFPAGGRDDVDAAGCDRGPAVGARCADRGGGAARGGARGRGAAAPVDLRRAAAAGARGAGGGQVRVGRARRERNSPVIPSAARDLAQE